MSCIGWLSCQIWIKKTLKELDDSIMTPRWSKVHLIKKKRFNTILSFYEHGLNKYGFAMPLAIFIWDSWLTDQYGCNACVTWSAAKTFSSELTDPTKHFTTMDQSTLVFLAKSYSPQAISKSSKCNSALRWPTNGDPPCTSCADFLWWSDPFQRFPTKFLGFLSAAAGGGLALDFLDASDTQYTAQFKFPSNIQKGHIGSIWHHCEEDWCNDNLWSVTSVRFSTCSINRLVL